MKYTKIILINILLFSLFLISLEIFSRIALVINKCLLNRSGYFCDNYSILYKLGLPKYENYSNFDTELGHVPKSNFFGIEEPFYSVFFNTNEKGFRKNGSSELNLKNTILAFGDSYTFGGYVKDEDTWPSCLEKKLNTGVANAGVGGYGSAQALKRAIIEIKKNSYETLIFSILVNNDFKRDRMDYRDCFPRSPVIKNKSTLEWARVSDPLKKGTVFNPTPIKFPIIYENSYFFKKIVAGLGVNQCNLNSTHPQAASVDEIIKWTLLKFSKLPIKKKILVLQYSSSVQDTKNNQERDLILLEASKLKLPVVDTYNALKSVSIKKTWWGSHLTPFGNQLTCTEIYKTITKLDSFNKK